MEEVMDQKLVIIFFLKKNLIIYSVMDGLMDAAKLTKWRDSMTVP